MPDLPRFIVRTMPRAYADIVRLHKDIGRESPQNANLVVDRILEAIDGLEFMPKRWGIARESPRRGQELRQIPESSFRIIFQVVGDRVEVLTVRHAKRRNAKFDG